jgi:hypothetical protein
MDSPLPEEVLAVLLHVNQCLSLKRSKLTALFLSTSRLCNLISSPNLYLPIPSTSSPLPPTLSSLSPCGPPSSRPLLLSSCLDVLTASYNRSIYACFPLEHTWTVLVLTKEFLRVCPRKRIYLILARLRRFRGRGIRRCAGVLIFCQGSFMVYQPKDRMDGMGKKKNNLYLFCAL